jgi:hypothetical protein
MYIMIDVESDGPIPGDYSMISFGAVVVDDKLDKTFYSKLRPISPKFVPEALAISGFSREETLQFTDPGYVMSDFQRWLDENAGEKPVMVSDCSYDWMFICWYFNHFLGHSPLGYWSENLESLYKGIERDMDADFTPLRKTPHTHNPLDDAVGNAEALLLMRDTYPGLPGKHWQ